MGFFDPRGVGALTLGRFGGGTDEEDGDGDGRFPAAAAAELRRDPTAPAAASSFPSRTAAGVGEEKLAGTLASTAANSRDASPPRPGPAAAPTARTLTAARPSIPTAWPTSLLPVDSF